MKTTSKILLAVIALFIISSSSVFAKKKSHGSSSDGRFSIGAEVGLPMGNFGDFSNVGFGGSVRYEMPLSGSDNIALTGTAGYLSFSAKNSDASAGFSESVSLVPIMVGGKYYFTEQQNGFYVAVALGVTIGTFKETQPGTPAVTYFGVVVYPATPAETVSTSQTNFTFAQGVGYALSNWDFSVNYNDVTATGGSLAYLGLRVAYVLGGK